MSVRASCLTAPGRSAIAVIALVGNEEIDLHSIVRRAGLVLPEIGTHRLFAWQEIDQALLARPSRSKMLLFTHGNDMIVSLALQRLREAGAAIEEGRCAHWMIAGSETIARHELLRCTLGCAAVDGVLAPETPIDRIPRALLEPVTVVLAGAPNIGKSTLLNALAGRDVALVEDEPGTTRDATQTLVDLNGVVVRWTDVPGLRAETADPIESEAILRANRVIDEADLLIAGADATSDWPLLARESDLRVALRADLGVRPGADLRVTREDRSSLEALARRVAALALKLV